MVTINAGFNRRATATGTKRTKRRYEWKNAVGLDFPDLEFKSLTPSIIRAHPAAPTAADGWALQGWCEHSKEDAERRCKVSSQT